MDVTTISGIIGFAILVFIGFDSEYLSSFFFNPHGIFMVFGGTAVAILINTPLKYLIKAISGLKNLFIEKTEASPEKIIPFIIELSEQCRINGLKALKDVDTTVAKGFLSRTAMAAFEYNDPIFVRQIVEEEINQSIDEKNETVNVYRTMSILAPMFGMLGTLL